MEKNNNPIQEALIPDEATPAMLCELLPHAAKIMSDAAKYIVQVQKLVGSKNNFDKLEQLSPITQSVFDSVDLAQNILKQGRAIENLLTAPLQSQHAIGLNQLRASFELKPDETVDPDSGEIKGDDK